MDEKQQPGQFLQKYPGFSLKAPHRAQPSVIELSEPCEILEPGGALDLRAYGQVLRKRLSTILMVLLVIFVTVAIATLKQKPVYRAQVVLDIQKENPDIPTIQELYALESVSDTYLRTQYSILSSESLARGVIAKLNLDTLREFNAPKWWSWSRRTDNTAQQTFGTGTSTVNRDESQQVLERFQARLTVEPINHSRLVTVRFDSHDPNLAARVVNTLAADYIHQNLQARWAATQGAADWLSQQLSTVQAKLEKSENELQDYARRKGLIFIEKEKGTSENVANERLQQLQEELTRAEAERYSKEALYRLVQAGDYGSLPGVFENRMLQDLTERLAELKRQHAQLSATFNPDYPRVKETQSQIDEIESSLEQERNRAATYITNEYMAAQNREHLVRQALAEQQKQLDVIAAQSVQYNILKREVDTNKQLYEGLLQELKSAGLSASLKATNIRIVDPAEPPAKPVKPRIPLNLALGAALGLALGVCAALVQERLDDTVKGAADVERLLGFSALALIPAAQLPNGNHRDVASFHVQTKASLSVGHNGNGHKTPSHWPRIDAEAAQQAPLLEAFRSLRTSILLSRADGPPSSLLVTSTQPAEGKTTIASNLSIALAQIGHKVLLIDADLRSPSLHRLFGMPEKLGLVSYLAGQKDWRASVRFSETTRLDLLLCGPVPPNAAELLSSSRIETLINSARQNYDFVILDSAPLLAVADSRLLVPRVSGVLLVVKNAAIPRDQVLHAQSSICCGRGNLIGVILNRVDLHTNGYYYDSYSRNGSTDQAPPGETPAIDQFGWI